jgi:hypothetical protein
VTPLCGNVHHYSVTDIQARFIWSIGQTDLTSRTGTLSHVAATSSFGGGMKTYMYPPHLLSKEWLRLLPGLTLWQPKLKLGIPFTRNSNLTHEKHNPYDFIRRFWYHGLRRTVGVTGQQRMFTPPWNLIPPSYLSEVRIALHAICICPLDYDYILHIVNFAILYWYLELPKRMGANTDFWSH